MSDEQAIAECRTYLDGLLSKANSEQRTYGLSFIVDRALEDAERFLTSCPDLGTEVEDGYHEEIAEIRREAERLEPVVVKITQWWSFKHLHTLAGS